MKLFEDMQKDPADLLIVESVADAMKMMFNRDRDPLDYLLSWAPGEFAKQNDQDPRGTWCGRSADRP